MNYKFTKRALIGILVLSFYSMQVSAQTYSNTPSSLLSFSAGITSSNLLNDSVHYHSGVSFAFGVNYVVVLSEKLNAAIDVQYAGRAFATETPIIKYRFYYVDVPLYLQYKFSESIRLNAGFQYSQAANAQIIYNDHITGTIKSSYNSIKPVDLGCLLGLEFDVKDDFGIGARYTISTSAFGLGPQPDFSSFQVSLKYTAFRTYKQFFHKKESE